MERFQSPQKALLTSRGPAVVVSNAALPGWCYKILAPDRSCTAVLIVDKCVCGMESRGNLVLKHYGIIF